MTIKYIKLEPQEELILKKIILEAIASGISTQETAARLSKLKSSKTRAKRGLITAMKEINSEIKKIKDYLPELKKREQKRQEKTESTESRLNKTETSKNKKTKYEAELEEIKERIASLG